MNPNLLPIEDLSWNMPPLAAAATECRLDGSPRMRRINMENKHDKCFVQLQGELLLRYLIRPVGLGPALPPPCVRLDAPRRFEQCFDLHDPAAFFGSYSACRDAIHDMLMQTPLLCGLDLAADNWDAFVPHDNVRTFRDETQKLGGVAPRYSAVLTVTIWADVLYNEPKALLLACMHAADAAARTTTTAIVRSTAADCCVCMEDLDLAAAAQDTVRLPCSHSFHRDCIGPWFYKKATCPMCRCDVSNCLVAITNTPQGKFPGLSVVGNSS